MRKNLEAGPIGLDFETTTYKWTDAGFKTRCAGLANDTYSLCVDFKGESRQDVIEFLEWLTGLEYVAQNVQMEAGVLFREVASMGRPIADTYIVFADLASEEKRSWNLNTLMEDLLGLKKEGDKVKEHMQELGLGWEDVFDFDFEILGRYCAIDASGTWEAYKHFVHIIESSKSPWKHLYWDYHRQDFLTSCLLQVEARWLGLNVDVEALEETHKDTIKRRDDALNSFVNNPKIKPCIKEIRESLIQELKTKEPEKFIKSGALRKTWVTWNARMDALQTESPINYNSSDQLAHLLYDKVGLEVPLYTDTGKPSTGAKALSCLGELGQALLDYRGYVTQLKFLKQLIDSNQNGKVHPDIKLPGTVTTRASGGNIE